MQDLRPWEAHSCDSRVAVVVPSFNHAPFVERCLRSIFAQSTWPSQLLVIDDGSSDNSPQIIERVLADCPFECDLVVRSNRGLCATLNQALALTAGEYFAYLGSDDAWLPGFLSARLKLLDSRPRAALAYGHAYIIDSEDRIVGCTQERAPYSDGDVRRMLTVEIRGPSSPTVVYRRDAVERHGWNEAARLEDYELYLRLSAHSEFAFDARVLSAWRRHDRNTSKDLNRWLDELLLASERAAGELGMSKAELSKCRSRIMARMAENFANEGKNFRATELAVQSMALAPSAKVAIRIALRVMLPSALLRFRRRRAEQRAAARWGSLVELLE